MCARLPEASQGAFLWSGHTRKSRRDFPRRLFPLRCGWEEGARRFPRSEEYDRLAERAARLQTLSDTQEQV
jgi:hypothetical protein